MNKISFDITNLLGLILASVGSMRYFGIDAGLIISGVLMLVINFSVLLVISGKK
jgi:hypothetical protein